MTEPAAHHLRVQRTARYYTLGDTAGADRLWFVLHGYRQLASRFIRRFAPLVEAEGDGGAAAVVAPEGLSRFYLRSEEGRSHDGESRVGAAWMTREDREYEIADYVEYLDRLAEQVLASRGPGGAPAVTLLGFSQGSETASRWAVLGHTRFDRLVFWGGGPAEDLDMEAAAARLAGRQITFVHGAEDGWGRDKAERWAPRLEALDARVATLRFEGGHRVDPDVLVGLD